MRLTRNNFETWLKSKRPRQWVGESDNAFRCPLAMFLMEDGAPHPAVFYPEYWRNLAGGKRRALPRWADLFIHHVDKSRVRYITASRALKILEKIK